HQRQCPADSGKEAGGRRWRRKRRQHCPRVSKGHDDLDRPRLRDLGKGIGGASEASPQASLHLTWRRPAEVQLGRFRFVIDWVQEFPETVPAWRSFATESLPGPHRGFIWRKQDSAVPKRME